mmetsp:Transcript_148607/g.477120  ORF Transcript_148607/g.477120 Transcript_148607/m.477120 type:complete len:365 (+) Transcript_148607:234-1328(+)
MVARAKNATTSRPVLRLRPGPLQREDRGPVDAVLQLQTPDPGVVPLDTASVPALLHDPRDARPAELELVGHELALRDLAPPAAERPGLPHSSPANGGAGAGAQAPRGAELRRHGLLAPVAEAAEGPIQGRPDGLKDDALLDHLRLPEDLLRDASVREKFAHLVAEVIAIVDQHVVGLGGELVQQLAPNEVHQVILRPHRLPQTDDASGPPKLRCAGGRLEHAAAVPVLLTVDDDGRVPDALHLLAQKKGRPPRGPAVREVVQVEEDLSLLAAQHAIHEVVIGQRLVLVHVGDGGVHHGDQLPRALPGPPLAAARLGDVSAPNIGGLAHGSGRQDTRIASALLLQGRLEELQQPLQSCVVGLQSL